jgi:hypothetical protein
VAPRAPGVPVPDGERMSAFPQDATGWRRVTRNEPCPICSRTGWCGISNDGTAVICMRIQSPTATANGGWLHKIADAPRSPATQCHVIRAVVAPDLSELARHYREQATTARLEGFAGILGINPIGLVRIGTGWAGPGKWAFPMSSDRGRITGIRYRASNGAKWAETGGVDGVFRSVGDDPKAVLLVPEGATDSAALASLGFDVAGRPCCTGGTVIISRLARGRDLAIVADPDGPGRRGAGSLASAVLCYARSVRIVEPPAPHKDARAWIAAGATRDDVLDLIEAATKRVVEVRVRGGASHG